MRLKTHIASSLTIAYTIDVYLCIISGSNYCTDLVVRIQWYLLGFLVNYVIDYLGHSKVKGLRYKVRNVFHNLVFIVGLGLLVGSYMSIISREQISIVGGLLLTLIHYVEDMVTQGGVYLVGKRRIKKLGFKYRNKFVDRAVVIILIILQMSFSYWAIKTSDISLLALLFLPLTFMYSITSLLE